MQKWYPKKYTKLNTTHPASLLTITIKCHINSQTRRMEQLG